MSFFRLIKDHSGCCILDQCEMWRLAHLIHNAILVFPSPNLRSLEIIIKTFVILIKVFNIFYGFKCRCYLK